MPHLSLILRRCGMLEVQLEMLESEFATNAGQATPRLLQLSLPPVRELGRQAARRAR